MLQDKKLTVLNLLLAGESVANVAAKLGVCRVTIYRLMKEPDFVEEYNKVCKELFKHSQASLLSLQEAAINKAKELIETGSEEVASSLVQSILDRALPAHLSIEDLRASDANDPQTSH